MGTVMQYELREETINYCKGALTTLRTDIGNTFFFHSVFYFLCYSVPRCSFGILNNWYVDN
jgi:hypothetical protein